MLIYVCCVRHAFFNVKTLILLEVQTVDKSIRTLLIFPIYFMQNYDFSNNSPEVNLRPIFIILLSTKAENYVVYSYKFQTIF